MKIYILLLALSLLTTSLPAQFEVKGGIGNNPFKYSDGMGGTGLDAVYLLNTLSNATIEYTSTSSSVTFKRYQNSLAAGDLLDPDIPGSGVTKAPSGSKTVYTISNSVLKDGYGYMAQANGNALSGVWIIDYTLHKPQLNSIRPLSGEFDDVCNNLKLEVDKTDDLYFFATNGGRRDIKRLYSITYNTLKWDDVAEKYINEETIIDKIDIGTEYEVDAPLKNTTFTITGDQFAKELNMPPVSLVSDEYETVAVKAYITTRQENRDIPNEIIKDEDKKLGGSAPVNIFFNGHGNEPAVEHYTWFLYRAQDMKNAVARYTDKDIDYNFDQTGDFIMMLEVADYDSRCVDSTSVRFRITESFLDQPNYFSPGDSPGSNDEFRVTYKSLVSFKCTIFNRWGNKLYEWTDPAKGWDGKYKGKYVTTGVYFYVIQARGSDGIVYNRGGDINIVRQN